MVPIQSEAVTEVTLDGRGRLTVPKELRDRFGDRYHLVRVHDGIKLVPIDEEPLRALREEFADVEKSAAELREGGRDEALEQAGR